LTPIAFSDNISSQLTTYVRTDDDSDGHIRRNIRKGTNGRYKYYVYWDETYPGEPSHSWVSRHQMNGALFLIFEYPENDVPSNQVGANDDMDKTFLHRLKEATCLITSTLTREVIGKQHTE